MNCKIYSRFIGKTYTFSIPGSSYIYVDLGDEKSGGGMNGMQICHDGKLMGSTLWYEGGDQNEFEKICRKWMNKFVRNLKIEEGGG